MPPEQIATGLERETARPYERPMEPAAGLSSEEVSWSPDGRYIVSGSFPLFTSPYSYRQKSRKADL